MVGTKEYRLILWAVCLLLSSPGRAQELNGLIHPDSRRIHSDSPSIHPDSLLVLSDSLLIHFDHNSSRLRTRDKTVIDRALSRHAPPLALIKIDLSGHCDSVGGDKYNDRLSERRILSAQNYLRSRAIPDVLFGVMEGFGKRRPLNDNGDKDKRSLNRRVRIVLYFASARPSTPPPETPPSVTGRLNPTDPADGSSSPLHPSDDPAAPSPSYPRTAPSPSPTLREFFRDSAQTGKSFVLRNLNFEAGRHVLLPYSDTVLKDLLQIMLDSPSLKIQIRGHVCCIAPVLDGLDSDTRTEDLSVRRARFVYDYLIQGGVRASRMSYRGFGASQKLYPQERNEQEEEWNRRVEIKRKNPQD